MPDETRGSGVRLDSWKAIAAYLKRDVATVRRWEKDLGLPVHRVAGGGRSVFAHTTEIDAWLHTDPKTSQPVPDPTPARQSRRSLAIAAGAVLALAAASIAVLHNGSPVETDIVRLDVSSERVIGLDGEGDERWRHDFPRDPVHLQQNIGLPWLVIRGPHPAVYVTVAHTIRRADQQGGSGSLIEFTIDGTPERSFSFDDEVTFQGKKYGPPWAVTTLAVDDSTGSRRVAVAAHHYTWDPSPVTVLDEHWRRLGTFVHAGWIEALHWMAPDRLLIGGYSESGGGGMVALLDPARLDGQGPEEAGSRYHCETCGAARPLLMVVMPRTEVNRASGWRFNRALVEKLPDRVLARTVELEMDGGHADVIYEFSPSLDLVSARFSPRYWDAHAMLEAQGKIDHRREACPDRNGPREIRVWDPSTGWRVLSVQH